jgi:GNAT superfamily N-acetyltransferase
MPIQVLERPASDLPGYATIPIAFQVESRLRVEILQGGLGGFRLVEEAVTPCIKDYDAHPGEGPLHWQAQWDISTWGILAAFDGDTRVGGAVVARNTEGLCLLGGRHDLAALWDLRVHPDYRSQGVGSRLFEHAVQWAQEKNCRQLLVETQNVNVPACRFYARQGCVLGAINRYAYGDALDEVQLLWYRDL